jgi:tRNA-(ms[2]io[6]A)-hydroxylase
MRLRTATPPGWTTAVLADFDAFLLDHAACERKASASALAMVAHYPDRRELVDACIELAREELQHFREVHRRIAERGLVLAADTRNPYMGALGREFRNGSDAYFLDRLLAAAIAEARGCERFGLIAAALPPQPLKEFYRELARGEVRHRDLYVSLARTYFDAAAVDARLDELLEAEARIVSGLPIRAALY